MRRRIRNERKRRRRGAKKMCTVLGIGIMSLAGRHGISVWNSTSVELVGRQCVNVQKTARKLH